MAQKKSIVVLKLLKRQLHLITQPLLKGVLWPLLPECICATKLLCALMNGNSHGVVGSRFCIVHCNSAVHKACSLRHLNPRILPRLCIHLQNVLEKNYLSEEAETPAYCNLFAWCCGSVHWFERQIADASGYAHQALALTNLLISFIPDKSRTPRDLCPNEYCNRTA